MNLFGLSNRVLIAVLCLAAGFAKGETPKAPGSVPKPAATAEKEKADASKDKPRKSPAASAKSKPKDLSAEVAALRNEVASLRKKVEVTLDTLVKDLVAQNTYLREQLQKYEGPNAAVAIPRPGMDEPETPADTEKTPSEPKPVATVKEVTTLAEWGRTPEEAAARGGDATSLKGMIVVVPPDMDEAALIALGQKLRKDLEPYDNINVEVFNEVNAAQEFADTNRMSEERHVMTVSKHKVSGRDEILLVRDGKPEPVEREKQ